MGPPPPTKTPPPYVDCRISSRRPHDIVARHKVARASICCVGPFVCREWAVREFSARRNGSCACPPRTCSKRFTQVHARSHRFSHMFAHVHMFTLLHIHTITLPQSSALTHWHIHTLTHPHVQTFACLHIHTSTHPCIYTFTDTFTDTPMDTFTHFTLRSLGPRSCGLRAPPRTKYILGAGSNVRRCGIAGFPLSMRCVAMLHFHIHCHTT